MILFPVVVVLITNFLSQWFRNNWKENNNEQNKERIHVFERTNGFWCNFFWHEWHMLKFSIRHVVRVYIFERINSSRNRFTHLQYWVNIIYSKKPLEPFLIESQGEVQRERKTRDLHAYCLILFMHSKNTYIIWSKKSLSIDSNNNNILKNGLKIVKLETKLLWKIFTKFIYCWKDNDSSHVWLNFEFKCYVYIVHIEWKSDAHSNFKVNGWM